MPDAIEISPASGERLRKLQGEREEAITMLRKARAAGGAEGGPTLVRSLEREVEALDAAWQAAAAEATGDGPGGHTLARGQSMAGAFGVPSDVSLTQIVRGIGLGDWRGIKPDVRAQVSSIPAAIPGAVSAGIVDMAREQSVIFRAGAQLMPIDTPSAKVARMTSEPAVQWEPEAADRDLTDGSWTFDAAELTAESAWLYTTLSVEALEDCLNLDATIQTAFAAQLSLAFDQAGLVGSGADMPVGIINMGHDEDRIIETLDVGAIRGYEPFVRAAGAVKAAHHEPSSVILTPDLWTELACLTDDVGNPLQPPRVYSALNEFVSGFLPSNGGTGTDEHTVIVGDLSKLTIGVRTNITLEVSRLGAGFKKGAIEVRGYVRFGAYLTDPTAIAVLRGVKPPAGA